MPRNELTSQANTRYSRWLHAVRPINVYQGTHTCEWVRLLANWTHCISFSWLLPVAHLFLSLARTAVVRFILMAHAEVKYLFVLIACLSAAAESWRAGVCFCSWPRAELLPTPSTHAYNMYSGQKMLRVMDWGNATSVLMRPARTTQKVDSAPGVLEIFLCGCIRYRGALVEFGLQMPLPRAHPGWQKNLV